MIDKEKKKVYIVSFSGGKDSTAMLLLLLKKGYSWPDFRNRWCTSNLKQKIISQYLREKYPKSEYEIWEYHGIALDEAQRTQKNNNKNCLYPLVEWQMTEADCLQYCYDNGYDWNGLYRKLGRVSCWCCPLKSIKELKVLYKEFPEYWEKLKEWDNKTYRKFRADYSIEQLEERFKKEDNN